MLLALVATDWFAWMVLGDFTSENLGLELTLRELLAHLVVVMRCVDIWVTSASAGTRVVSMRTRSPHLNILLIVLAIVFFELARTCVLHDLRLLYRRPYHRTIVYSALSREEILCEIGIILQHVFGSILWSSIVTRSLWLQLAVIVFVALDVFLVSAWVVHMMIR